MFRADFRTRVGKAAFAHIAYFIFIILAGSTGGRDNLHQRRLIIFFGNIAGLDAISQVDRFVCRTQTHSHGKADTFRGNRTGTVNTVTVLRTIFRYDFIGNCFNIVDQ